MALIPLVAKSDVKLGQLRNKTAVDVNFAAITVQLPSYTLVNVVELSASPAGMVVFVSNANAGAGAVAYSDGLIWKDVGTNALVA